MAASSTGRFLVFFLLLAPLSGCGDRGTPLAEDHAGYPVYKKHCRRCHGNEGDGTRASRMADRLLDLASSTFRDTTDASRIEHVVLEGKGRMKGYEEKLSPEEVDDVVDYVLHLVEARAQARFAERDR